LYHAEFEKAKGKFTQVADDPETLRIKQNSKIIRYTVTISTYFIMSASHWCSQVLCICVYKDLWMCLSELLWSMFIEHWPLCRSERCV